MKQYFIVDKETRYDNEFRVLDDYELVLRDINIFFRLIPFFNSSSQPQFSVAVFSY